jgi:beta-N-acetylhexosaminidase
VDLLLMNHPAETENAAFEGLRVAIAGGRLGRPGLEAARGRILAMRRHFDDLVQPPIEVVGGEEHLRLAREIAAASVTLVRDPARVLPLRPESAGRVAVIAPALVDLTPAETSSYLQLGLAAALRTRGLDVAEIAAPLDPSPAEVAFIVAAAAEFRTVIVCTFDAVSFAGQVALVERLAGALPGQAGAGAATATAAQAAPTAPRQIVAVALRSPYDVATFPDGVAATCTYGVQPPQIEALADALTGRARFVGSLPVSLEAAS